VRDLCQPYKTPGDQRLREFARWLWTDHAADAELVCAETDLGRDFHLGQYQPAEYRCNQRIYSARHHQRKPPAWERISAQHPLRVVIHTREGGHLDESSIQVWLQDVQRAGEMQLSEVRRFRVNAGGGEVYGRYVDVYEFVPRSLRTSRAIRTSPGYTSY
jgi:hypothetical protein